MFAAIHIAKLADNDRWVSLIKLAEAMGQDDMVSTFRQALHDEARDVKAIRQWMDKISASETGAE
ncbi:MAG: hypothetical protein ACXWWJ_05160 [Nitrospira sp.]